MVLFFALAGLALALFELSQLLFGRETQRMFEWLRSGEPRKREEK